MEPGTAFVTSPVCVTFSGMEVYVAIECAFRNSSSNVIPSGARDPSEGFLVADSSE
jgi:hypothetical protein